MAYKLLLAATLSLGLGTGLALAQSDTTNSTVGATGSAAGDSTAQLPSGWEGPIGEAFFSDSSAGTLRTEDEVRANFQGLSAEQQAQVRTDCDAYDTASAAGANTSGDTTASAESSGSDDSLTTGSTTTGGAPGAGSMASMEQLCGWIDNM